MISWLCPFCGKYNTICKENKLSCNDTIVRGKIVGFKEQNSIVSFSCWNCKRLNERCV